MADVESPKAKWPIYAFITAIVVAGAFLKWGASWERLFRSEAKGTVYVLKKRGVPEFTVPNGPGYHHVVCSDKEYYMISRNRKKVVEMKYKTSPGCKNWDGKAPAAFMEVEAITDNTTLRIRSFKE